MLGRRGGDTGSLENSRLIFGYLSKVCPQLEDVTVRDSMMRCELESGLCLLSPLHKLQRLVLVVKHRPRLMSRDLEWMTREVSLAMWIRRFAVSWALTKTESMDVDQLAPFTSSTQTAQGGQGCFVNQENLEYMVDGVDMRHLRRIRDITDWIEERQYKRSVCRPLMDEIRVQIMNTRSQYTLKDQGDVMVTTKVEPLVTLEDLGFFRQVADLTS